MDNQDEQLSAEPAKTEESVLNRILTDSESKEITAVKPLKLVYNVLNKLRERERDILIARFGLNAAQAERETLESIGQKLSVTRERIRQIEKASLRKIGKKYATALKPLWKLVESQINFYGGVVSLDALVNYLQITTDQNPVLEKNALRLALAANASLEPLKKQLAFKEGWSAKGVNTSQLTAIQSAAIKILEQSNKPRLESELIELLVRETKENSAMIKGILLISPQLGIDNKGAWGLTAWSIIVPRRIRDKILIVLEEAGKPLHFNDITKLVSEKFKSDKAVLSRTVHNELIGDQRFVLVGRGIYALKIWGYKPGVVLDVIKEVLQKAGRPLHVSEIIKSVLTSRQVKRNTIIANLQNRKMFKKVAKATYVLAEDNQLKN